MHLAVRWVLYPILVCQVVLSPCRWASALDSVCWGIFVGQFRQHGGVYSGRWVVAVGRWVVLWVFRQFCGHFHGWLVVIQGLHLRGGVDLRGGGCICRGMVGRFLSCLKRGMRGRVDTANVAQGGRRALALPWWAFASTGGEAEGDGGGLLANTGLNRGELT